MESLYGNLIGDMVHNPRGEVLHQRIEAVRLDSHSVSS